MPYYLGTWRKGTKRVGCICNKKISRLRFVFCAPQSLIVRLCCNQTARFFIFWWITPTADHYEAAKNLRGWRQCLWWLKEITTWRNDLKRWQRRVNFVPSLLIGLCRKLCLNNFRLFGSSCLDMALKRAASEHLLWSHSDKNMGTEWITKQKIPSSSDSVEKSQFKSFIN